jgi:1-phosphatidylinositol-3-phosphate 5-kinase
VLLDENLMEELATDPILVTERSKRALDAALRRDAAFLSSLGVMDYSLLAGVDRRADELVVGVVDYLRQYTWDKQLETYVKQSGLVGGGGPGKTPTVISPGQYEKRFATAMRRYFVCVPDDDDDREGN